MANNQQGEGRQTFFAMFQRLVESGILRDLRPAELRLFFALCYFADFDTGKVHQSRETLMKLTGLSKDAFAAAIRELRRKGLISVKRASKRLAFKYQYVVHCFGAGNLHESKSAEPALVQETSTKAINPCFRPGNLEQSKAASALVQETSTKADGQDGALLSSGFEQSAFVQETSNINPLNPLKEERTQSKKEPESSPPLKAGSAPPPPPKPPLSEEQERARDKQMEELERQGINLPTCFQPKRKP